jgi:putative ABC transport system ATP-binding protein
MIDLIDIRKVFNAGRPNEFVAVNGISLRIESEKMTVFRGPSGSGKTTLLSMVGCLSRPTSGRIRLNDREISSLPERFLTEIRQNMFGFIFQQCNLIKGMTVLENVMIPAYPMGERHTSLKRRALDLLDTFKMTQKAESKTEWLSGGEAQRVAISRALINNPSYIIADEPTANLDTRLSLEFMEIMGKLADERRTVLIASHDSLIYESARVDRVIDLRDGRIAEREA